MRDLLRGVALKQILEIIKVSRPGFWPTHVWFYLLPFAQMDMLQSVSFWLGGVYVCFPLGLLLYGWNDIGDSETDALNARKGSWLFGARPDESSRKKLPWIILTVQLPFVLLFVWLADWKMLGWFIGVCLFNATYNNFGFKKIPGLDLLNQVGYLMIFVLGSWLCTVKQLNAPAMTFSALFAMQSHLFGQIMDVEEDRAAGRNTTAVAIGVRLSKWLLAAIMIVEATIAWGYLTGFVVPAFMVCGAIFFAVDAIVGPQKYPLKFLTVFFIGWNIVAIVSMHLVWRYGLFLLSD